MVTTEKFFTGYVMLQVENEMNDYNISGGSRGGAWEARPRTLYFGLKKKKKRIREGRKAGRAVDEKPAFPPP